MIESRVPQETLKELEQKGHNFKVRKEYSTAMGRGQAVLHNSKSNVNFAASDPRADGSAEPEPDAATLEASLHGVLLKL